MTSSRRQVAAEKRSSATSSLDACNRHTKDPESPTRGGEYQHKEADPQHRRHQRAVVWAD